MGITSASILFVVFILIYVMIAEVFTVLFRLTGLTEEKARFQVISMLTNSGYTTAESEIITSSKIRRRLARITMLFGYSFTVTIVSVVVNVFIALTKAQLKQLGGVVWSILLLCGAFYLFKYVPIIKEWFDRGIEKIGNQIMFGNGSNPVIVMDTYGDKVIAKVQLTHMPVCLYHTPLEKSKLKENYHIQIILIQRKGEKITSIKGNTEIYIGDVIIVFGDYKVIRELFERP